MHFFPFPFNQILTSPHLYFNCMETRLVEESNVAICEGDISLTLSPLAHRDVGSNSHWCPVTWSNLGGNNPLLAWVSRILFIVECFLSLRVWGQPLSYGGQEVMWSDGVHPGYRLVVISPFTSGTRRTLGLIVHRIYILWLVIHCTCYRLKLALIHPCMFCFLIIWFRYFGPIVRG